MGLRVTVIMLGVKDLARARKFYEEGLGCEIAQDYPIFVSLNLGDGSSSLRALRMGRRGTGRRRSSEGSGFRGFSLHYIVESSEAVDEIMAKAVAAGGSTVKEAAAAQWGYFGYFSDPDGYLWKVATS